LESIYFLGRGRSFRTRQARKLIKYGETSFSIFSFIDGPTGPSSLGAGFSEAGMKRQIDGNPKTRPLEMALSLPVFILDPNTHFLIEGSPTNRRQFLDLGVFHVEPEYLAYWKEYRRALSQRNAAIKRKDNFKIWNEAYIAAGKKVNQSRKKYIKGIVNQLNKIDEGLIKKKIEISYYQGWDENTSFEEAVKQSEKKDAVMGVSCLGPHRGDLLINLDSRKTKEVISRGQQKLITIGLVLAQVMSLPKEKQKQSLVLIDDLAAELDIGTLERLFLQLEKITAQIFITGLSKRFLPIKNQNYPMFHMEQGII
jgi:DNA replication and repair protein RecF|tara:strand:+ start:30096 stop:31028 length:933 start_codon:yes stop_codon:yes gene_type:complete